MFIKFPFQKLYLKTKSVNNDFFGKRQTLGKKTYITL